MQHPAPEGCSTQLDVDPEAGGPVTKLEVELLNGFEKIEVNE